MIEWLFVLAVVIVVILVAQRAARHDAERRLAEARAAYEQSLSELKRRPTDADLKQRTLALGRTYASLARERRGQTLFDEVMLSNDLSAATAGAGAPPAPTPVPAKGSVVERLGQLDALKAQGLISDAEYAERRRRILDEV